VTHRVALDATCPVVIARRAGKEAMLERTGARPMDGAFAPAVAETHSGLVFFVGDRAYKLKKPVGLGFLDFTSREAREGACHREVELNRRLAPDVYLGVADVLDPGGAPCDHLVTMRRMPADRRLTVLVQSGAAVRDHLAQLAVLIAEFHERAERSPAADRAASADALAGRWSANTSELEPFTDRLLDGNAVRLVETLAQRYLAGRHPLFDDRVARGRACDGHGDLLADDIFCLPDGPRVLDCLEYDDALRLGDVLADVAFLAMDLERLGRPDLADEFLAAYRERSGDAWPSSLEHHHIAYRAQVRAKVSAIRADQGIADAAEKARRLLALALAHLNAARVRLVIVGGLPGTGKSTLARGIGHVLRAPVLRSDVLRKELAGLEPGTRAPAVFGEGLYGHDTTTATYRDLLQRTADALGMGDTVVLDASWSSSAHRADARSLARATQSELVELRCVAPPHVAAARMRARAEQGADPSDADSAIAAAMAAVADPWPEAASIDTNADPDEVLAAAIGVVRSAT
jgi:uncharacterized protein